MIDMATATPQYQYYLKDHLGNTRVVVNSDNTAQQITNYYAFGLTSQSYQSGTSNKYLYNGKELQDDLIAGRTLDWLDYGARMYDPMLGRFHTVDPLAEIYSFQSQFIYASNNPISNIDYNGEEAVLVIGGVAIGLVEFGLLATGVISYGWMLSRNPYGKISINTDLFAKNNTLRSPTKSKSYRLLQKQRNVNKKPKFNPILVGIVTTTAVYYYAIAHKEGTNVGHHEYKIDNFNRFYFNGRIDFNNIFYGKPFFQLNETETMLKTRFEKSEKVEERTRKRNQ